EGSGGEAQEVDQAVRQVALRGPLPHVEDVGEDQLTARHGGRIARTLPAPCSGPAEADSVRPLVEGGPVVGRAEGRPRPARRVARGLAALLLGGLTSMEVLALTIGFVAAMAVLWATHTTAPERLITEPSQRVGWILAVVAVLRPVTWIPYLIVFEVLRRL